MYKQHSKVQPSGGDSFAMLQTKDFELATYEKGDRASPRLAIVIPGRLDTKDYAHVTTLVNLLAGKGYYALAFDPPGIWESKGGIDMYTTTNYVKAIAQTIEHFGNRPTLLAGHSRGGSAAMLVGATNSQVIGVVGILANYGPPSAPSPETMRLGFKVTYRDLPPGTSRTLEQKEFKLPMSYFTDGAQYNPLEALRKITKPKLLIYGTKDEFTSVALEKSVFESIPEPKMMEAVEAEHDYRLDLKAIERVNAVVQEFLERYLSNKE